MKAIEPIKIEVESSGLDLSDYSSRLGSPATDWDETYDFLVHKSLESDFQEISQTTIIDEYREIFDQKFKEPHEVLSSLQEHVTEWMRPPAMSNIPLYYKEDIVCFPNKANNGIFYLISNNKNRVRSQRDDIIETLEEAPDIYGEMGLDSVDVYCGQEFTKKIVSEIDQVESVEIGEPDEFESSIFEELEPISESFVHNITVKFDSPQEPEYDILFSLSPNNTLSIEVEDHSGTDNEPNEDDLIDNPVREGDFINAEKVFTVCKGVSSDRLGELRLKSELTNVDILKKEQCSERVLDYIESPMIQKAITGSGKI